MKNIKILSIGLISVISSYTINSQNLDNEIYTKNNRYTQNALYNSEIQLSRSEKSHFELNVNQFNEEYTEIEVNALYNAKADSYLAILSIIQNGASAVEVDSMINLRYNGLCYDLGKYGIKKENIFIDMISMIPIYETHVEKKLFSKTYNEVPVGFKLQKNIHIYYEKGDDLDRILTVASKHEIYDLIKVEYFVENTQAIYDTLTNLSINVIRKKINNLKRLGIVLDTLKQVYIDNKNVYFPVDRYKAYNSYGGISLTSKKNNSIKETKKTPTMFYNKIPYHKFDIILNPSFREPAVQYTYSIIARYYLKPEQKPENEILKDRKPQNIYYFITPEGNVKKLNIN